MTDVPQTARRRAALAFILVTVVLDIMALGVVIPVLPILIEDFTGSASQAGWVIGVFNAAWSLMQFLFSPVMGALSDRFGRRPVLLLSNAGVGLDYILMAMAPTLWLLAIGRVLSGITAATVSSAFAYIADVTPPERRAQAFGLIGACFGLGFILGPVLGGWLGDIDPRLPFWVAGGMSLANFAYGFFVLPESLPRERRTPFSWKRANPMGAFNLLNSNPQLIGLAVVNVIAQTAHHALPTVFALYALERYDWGAQEVGWVLAGIGVCAAVVQGGLTGLVVKRFGERTALFAGLLCGGAGFAVYGLAPEGWLFVLGVPLMALWGLAGPSTMALMTRMVSPSFQGQLQGANMSLGSLSGVVAPLVFGGVFYLFAGELRGLGLIGAPFLLAAALMVAAAAVAGRAARRAAEADAREDEAKAA